MKQHNYICLLRGINVGGNNIIKMADLRDSFEKIGFSNVSTYIQTGNILFTSTEKKQDTIHKTIEKKLKATFGYTGNILIHTAKEYITIIDSAPKNFGKQPESFRYDVLFLFPTLTASNALKEITCRENVDTAQKGHKALFFTRTKEHISKSYLSKVIQLPLYKEITIRNWNTSIKLKEKLNHYLTT